MSSRVTAGEILIKPFGLDSRANNHFFAATQLSLVELTSRMHDEALKWQAIPADASALAERSSCCDGLYKNHESCRCAT